MNTTGPVDDVDALLRESGTVCEPSVGEVLGSRADMIHSYMRWEHWRNGPGHRTICPECNTAFIRDRGRVRRCLTCRRAGKKLP